MVLQTTVCDSLFHLQCNQLFGQCSGQLVRSIVSILTGQKLVAWLSG